MDYVKPWTTSSHGLRQAMDYVKTWTTSSHGLHQDMDYIQPWTTSSHGLHQDMDYTLLMHSITIGMDHVKALASLLQSSSNLKELAVGGSLLQPLDLEADVVKQLVKGVLAPSSLKTVTIRGCFYPLDYIEAISTTISSLTFECFMRLDSLNMPPRVNPRRVKGGTKLSHILRRNRSLKELKLHIPLDKDEIHDIIDSLKDNRSLERLWLSEEYHSQYFSESEKQAMDTRITLAHH